MKKSALLLTALCLSLITAPLQAQLNQPAIVTSPDRATPVDNATLDFTLVNDLGFEILELYLSGHGQEAWGEDILGDDVLADGDELPISFEGEESESCWDLQIKDADGKIWHWKKGFDMTQIRSIRLHFKPNGQAWATATPATAYGCESTAE